MNLNALRKEWFFAIEEAPVLVTVTHKGVARDVRMHHEKVLIAAYTGDTFPSNTMTDIASRPPQSPRFPRDRPTLERRAGVWLRDFNFSAVHPGFSMAGHLTSLPKTSAVSEFVRPRPHPGKPTEQPKVVPNLHSDFSRLYQWLLEH